MKTCPKCNGKYFDDDEYCSECNIALVDNKEYNEILAELQMMTYEELEKHKYDKRYRVAYKYNYSHGSISGSSYTSKTSMPVKQSINSTSNIPTCPTCGSTNVKHISTLNRAVSIGVFGLFSSKIGKNYECLNCKAKW